MAAIRAGLLRHPVGLRQHQDLLVAAGWLLFWSDASSRLAGDDSRAGEYARVVIDEGTAPDGTELAPMRMAEARLTLAVGAVRAGEPDRTAAAGIQALRAGRRSIPSLLMVAGDLHLPYPNAPETREYGEALRT